MATQTVWPKLNRQIRTHTAFIKNNFMLAIQFLIKVKIRQENPTILTRPKHKSSEKVCNTTEERYPKNENACDETCTWLTLRSGDTSTACLLTVPARPIRVESSRGPLLMMAFTSTCRGFWRGGGEAFRAGTDTVRMVLHHHDIKMDLWHPGWYALRMTQIWGWKLHTLEWIRVLPIRIENITTIVSSVWIFECTWSSLEQIKTFATGS